MFVIVFPQLLLVLYWDKANTYGSVFSFFIGLLLRLLCGEPKLGLPASISFGHILHPDYESYDVCTAALAGECPAEDYDTPEKMEGCLEAACTGPVPFRTICMLLSLVSNIIVVVDISRVLIRHFFQILHLVITSITHYLFTREKVDLRFDFFDCFEPVQSGKVGKMKPQNTFRESK